MYNALRLLALVCACVHLAAEALHNQTAIYVTKPLTTALLVGVALAARPPSSRAYQALVASGLGASLAGDVLLMLPGDLFALGLASFLVAHICYTVAFAHGRERGLGLVYALPFAVFGCAMLVYLWPRLAMLKPAVALYVLAIQVMAWQAVATYAATRRTGALLAAIGACVFLVSDSLLALDRFRGHFRGASLGVMATYYLAQALIASSVRADIRVDERDARPV